MQTSKKTQLGWSENQERHFARILEGRGAPEQLYCARVIGVSRNLCRVLGERGETTAVVPGRIYHAAESRSTLPAVGDWVVLTGVRAGPGADPGGGTSVVQAVLERKTRISRKVPGEVTEEQIIAANVDAALIVTGLDDDYNIKRIERYLTLVLDFGIDPLLVLNKVDLCADAETRVDEVESAAVGFPVLAVSAESGRGMQSLRELLEPGRTYALLGSSGVGKSTILNRLLGREAQRTRTVREGDSRGRHTTTARELFVAEGGALLIDNPGMRELQLWGDEQGLIGAFDDIAALTAGCRFKDCTHMHEPGCAVREAVRDGSMASERLESYHKLQRELSYLERKVSESGRDQKARWKSISKQIRKYYKQRR